MKIEIKPYDPRSQQDAFSNFVAETYGKNSFLLREKYVDWWFFSSAATRNESGAEVLLAWSGPTVVGMNAHIASQVSMGSSVEAISWLANTMVRPEFRRGIGVRLLQEAIAHHPNLGSISFSPVSARMLESLGFEMFGGESLSRAACLLDPQALSRMGFCPPAPTPPASPDPFRAKSALPFPVEVDSMVDLWSRVAHRYGFATVRDHDHFKWRYLDHPFGRYLFLATEPAQPRAACIVRIDGTTLHAGRIVDLFGEETQITPLLLAVKSWARAQSCSFIDFFCSATPDRQSFLDAGFDWLLDSDRSAIPFLLNPPTIRPYHEQVALRLTSRRVAAPLERFYFVRGDADRDRPQ